MVSLDEATILVVDDEQTMREGCSRILSKAGWTAITAENGKQALETLRTHPGTIDVVLLDLMMPGVSGMEVMEQARPLDPNLLIIVITGYATVESAVEAMKKGAYDFIPKPFTPDQLRIVVRRALERKALQKEAEFLRKERERSLRDISTEKSKIITIINAMGDGVLVCDQDGIVVLTNPAANRMLQISGEALVTRPVSETRLPPDLSSTIVASLLPKDRSYASISQELTLGSAEEICLRAHTAPVSNDLGQIMGTVTVLQDISTLKNLDKMKSEFIAMVAHELRAPIAAVEQQLTAILQKTVGDLTEKQDQMLTRAKDRTQAVLTLIKDLLDLSKIEAGKMVQYKEPLSLQEIIHKVVDFMKEEAEKNRIDLRCSFPDKILMVCADRNSMEEVFSNLISNAIKYTPEQGKVSMSLEEEGDFVKATVSDTGIGIQKEDIPRIFDRFYRVKSKETRQIIGTGLGLSIVKSIVDAHLGSISVQSEPGKGSTFTVLLPKELSPTISREEKG